MINYYIGIAKKLSFWKILNFTQLYFSFHYSRVTKKPNQFAYPFFISIEPTTSCNLRCPQCPSGLRAFTRDTGALSLENFKQFISPLKKYLHSLTFYFQGEPYLNREFLEMVVEANKLNLYTITSTNAHYMTQENAIKTVESKLDKLIISVDGITQDTYEKYRIGGVLSKVMQGTEEIVKQKRRLKSKTPHIVWQFIVFKSNEHQIELVKELGKKFGVDEVKIKTAQIYDFENNENIIPENEKYSRYKKNADGNYSIKNKLLNQCWRMWQGCVITWDGKIVPCCFDKDAKYTLGNLKNDSFKDIWFSQEYNNFRRSILKGRNQIDICTNCSEGTEVFTD